MAEEKPDRYTPEQRAKINAKYAELIAAKEAEGIAFYTVPNDVAMSIVREVLEETATASTKPTLTFPSKQEEAV